MNATFPPPRVRNPRRRPLPMPLVGLVVLCALCQPTRSLLGDEPGKAAASQPARPAEGEPRRRAELPEGVNRVLFLGDSITYSGQYVALVEAYFVTRHPGRRVEFVNVGLPSETVSGLSEEGHADGQFPRPDLHERLGRVLEKVKPDLVFACYGMNDGIYQPLDEERFGKFRDGIERLHAAVEQAGVKAVHLTPPPFDGTRFAAGDEANYDRVLARYAEWLLERRGDGWDVVDLHGPMNDFLAARRQDDPAFALAGDGVHPGELGHWLMANQVLLHLGAEDLAKAEDGQAMLAAHPHGPAVFELLRQRQDLMRDAWLTETKHARPGINPGPPLAEAGEKAADLDAKIDELAGARG